MVYLLPDHVQRSAGCAKRGLLFPFSFSIQFLCKGYISQRLLNKNLPSYPCDARVVDEIRKTYFICYLFYV